MSDQRRRPASFSLDPIEPSLEAVRRPSAFDLREGDVAPDEIDVFALAEQEEAEPRHVPIGWLSVPESDSLSRRNA